MAEQGEPHNLVDGEAGSAQEEPRAKAWSQYFMIGGLLAGYGFMASLAVRFLYPSKQKLAWVFVTRSKDMVLGQSLIFKTTAGQSIAIARTGNRGGSAADFVALSSVCPHLGCQVTWQEEKKRFFCPCHNGAFDARGRPTEGPPKAENLELPRFELQLRNGLLYIQVPVESLGSGGPQVKGWIEPAWEHAGPGHDPCLEPSQARSARMC